MYVRKPFSRCVGVRGGFYVRVTEKGYGYIYGHFTFDGCQLRFVSDSVRLTAPGLGTNNEQLSRVHLQLKSYDELLLKPSISK